MSNIKIDPLTRENYDTWVIQAEAVLIRQHLWKFIQETDAAVQDKEGDRQARSQLILIIAPSELKQIKNCSTALELWNKLKNIYASKGPAKKASLLKQLILTRLEGNDVRSHLNIFMDIVDKLADMDVNINEDLLTIMMLYSLSSDYDNFRVAIETRDTLPKPDELKTKIIEECEARHSRSINNQEKPSELPIQEEAFYASCKICKRKGNIFKRKSHKICTNCWDKNNEKAKQHKSNSHKNHFATKCLLTNKKKPDNSIWILDSGCTSHMTYERDLFKKIDKSSGKLKFATDELDAEIKGKGTVSFTTKNDDSVAPTHLKDTLYVPSLSTNLMSVSKMTDVGCSVLFNKDKATVTNPKSKITLTAYKQNDGLYYMQCKHNKRNNLANTASTTNKNSNINEWHKKLGHMNAKDLKYAQKNDALLGLNFDNSESLDECEACIQAKLHRVSAPREKTTQRTKQLLEIVHSDVCGPIRTPTLNGNRYFVTFIDDFSRYSRVYFMRNKNEVLERFKEFKESAETHTGNKVKYLQSDNGTEYVNKDFNAFLKCCGIERRLSAPYTASQNGLAERKNRTLIEKARAMMIDAKAPLKCWGEAIFTANYLCNRSINSAIHHKTPFEQWVGRKPCINHLYIFGCKTYVLLKNGNSHKFASKAIQGMFVGYSETSKAFRIYIPSKNKIIISKDVRVMRKMFYDEQNKNEDSKLLYDLVLSREQTTSQPIPRKQVEITLEDDDDDDHEEIQQQIDSDAADDDDETLQQSVLENVRQENVDIDSDQTYESLSDTETEETTTQNMRSLRDRSTITAPKRYDDFILAAAEEIENLQKPIEPVTFKEALDSPEKEKWQEAMDNEISALINNETWDLVDLPKGRKALPCKWVYKVKMNPDGLVERYKARMVIKGYSQEPGVDYDKTFSPVVRMSTVRTLLAVSAQEKLSLMQFDVSTAFLNGTVNEEIYMKQPTGYQDGTKRVCKLKRSLYGLKQAPRCWNICIAEFLIKSGFVQNEADPCLYVRVRGQSKVFIALYVDDGLVAYNTIRAGEDFIKELRAKFKITTKPASYFLGMEIKISKDAINLCQKTYTKKVLSKFRMADCKPAPTPIIRENEKAEERNNVDELFPYRQAVGALAYLSVGTRPDISYAVGVASRNLGAPTKNDVLLVKRIFRYLKGTPQNGLKFTKNSHPNNLICYSDADHAGDSTTGRSTSGMVCLYSGAAISWRSQLQTMVSISSTEAEVIAASETAQEILWLNRLLNSLTRTRKPVLRLDNESAVKLSHNPKYEYHKRTKHIKLKHFFVRECVSNGEFTVEQVSSELQLADMLTKPLFGPRIKDLSSRMGLKNLTSNS